MLLNELFNTKLNIDVRHNDDESFVTRADINGNEYEFIANAVTSSVGKRWEVEFSVIELDDEGGEARNYDLTNHKEQFQVLSFVLQSMEQLISAQDPQAIWFMADKQTNKQFKDGTPKEKFRTRADAYETIFKKIKGYRMTRHTGRSSDQFTLVKI